MRVEPCCVPADDEALRPPSVATRALFEEARRILDARIVRVAAELHANRAPATETGRMISSGHLPSSGRARPIRDDAAKLNLLCPYLAPLAKRTRATLVTRSAASLPAQSHNSLARFEVLD